MVQPITALDQIISGNARVDLKVSLASRLSKLLFSERELNCTPYIIETVEAFINHKEKIEINLHNLDLRCRNKELLDLIFYPIVSIRKEGAGSTEKYINLPKKVLLNTFKNVNYLYIDSGAVFEYPVPLIALLEIISDTAITKIDIIGGWWLSELCGSSSFVYIKNKYQKENFKLTYDNYKTLTILKNIL